MKKQLLPLLCMLPVFLKAQNSSFEITGALDKINKGKIYLNIYEADKTVIDSTTVTHGNFEFKGSAATPVFATLTMPDKREDYFAFYIEPAKMRITGRADSLKSLAITGSRLNDDNAVLKERMKNVAKWEAANAAIYEEAYKKKNTAVMDSLDEVDFNVLSEKRRIVAGFVKDFPQSEFSAIAILENYGYYAEAAEVEPLYDLLGKDVKNSAKGLEIKKLIDIYKTVAIGNIAPEIMQATPGGATLSLSSLRGKYVLVDFWASWCGPCRRENPNIVKVYNRFKDKSFTIFGVSYDSKKTNWKKAIDDDRLDWNQVSELRGWKNSTSDQYGIKAIPSNLLLDKEGKIIAKNIFGKKLENTLSAIFPGN